MHFKLICCDVLTREACYCIARSPHTISPVFNVKDAHNQPAELRALLQGQVDSAEMEAANYDTILLAYGLCGNAVNGLRARRTPLVIPRAHDCTTLFLGSKEAFQEHFGENPSQAWASVGYSERGESLVSDGRTRSGMGMNQTWEELVELYGEENAQYLVDAMRVEYGSQELFLLDVPETHLPHVIERIRQQAKDQELGLREITGNLRLIDGLLKGEWPEAEYLTVAPGHRVEACYDYETIMTSAAAVPEDAPQRM